MWKEIFITIFSSSIFYFPPCSTAKNDATPSKFLIVHVLSACSVPKTSASKIHYFKFYNKHGQTIVNLTLEFKETLRAPLAIKVEGERCDMQKIDQCNSIPGINYDHFCAVFAQSYYGTTFFSKMDPPVMGCPIKKGTYIMDNVPVDHTDLLKTVPFPPGRYKFKNIIYDMKKAKKRPVLCWIYEFRIQTTSKRS